MLEKIICAVFVAFNILIITIKFEDVARQDYSNTESEHVSSQIHLKNDFYIEKVGHSWVIFSWQLPENLNEKYSQNIYRNNKLIASIAHKQDIFKDKHLQSSQSYSYHIQLMKNGKIISRLDNIQASTTKNSPPRFKQDHIKVINKDISEVGTHIMTLAATDQDHDRLYFNISEAGSPYFMINQTTGELINKSALIKNTLYTVDAMVSDGMATSYIKISIQT